MLLELLFDKRNVLSISNAAEIIQAELKSVFTEDFLLPKCD